MYVITVSFEVDPRHCSAFDAAMVEQARNSLAREEGCLFFDVCRAPVAGNRWFLYEIYTTEAAFQLHLASEHLKSFDAQVAPWLLDKQVQAWERRDALPLAVKTAPLPA